MSRKRKAPASHWLLDWLNSPDRYWETFAGQRELLDMEISEVKTQIGSALMPALVELSNMFDRPKRI